MLVALAGGSDGRRWAVSGGRRRRLGEVTGKVGAVNERRTVFGGWE
jgi:hypothetical protein